MLHPPSRRRLCQAERWDGAERARLPQPGESHRRDVDERRRATVPGCRTSEFGCPHNVRPPAMSAEVLEEELTVCSVRCLRLHV